MYVYMRRSIVDSASAIQSFDDVVSTEIGLLNVFYSDLVLGLGLVWPGSMMTYVIAASQQSRTVQDSAARLTWHWANQANTD